MDEYLLERVKALEAENKALRAQLASLQETAPAGAQAAPAGVSDTDIFDLFVLSLLKQANPEIPDTLAKAISKGLRATFAHV